MKTIIIAEAGVNHNGSIKIAKQLVDAAAESGVDYIKFQTFITEKCISVGARKAEYQKKNSSVSESQFDMVKKLELSFAQFVELRNYCNTKGIKFLSTGFDHQSLIFLSQLGISIAKIPSGEITNLPYLRKAASLFNHFIISTGMANLDEIRDAISVFTHNGILKKNITILHCNTEYPTPFQDVNLKAMQHIKKVFGTPIGYSDHTLGIEVPIAAVALGATVIEKHFTIDRNLPGPDHKASLEPGELKAMVKAIRNIEQALGDGQKKVSESERVNKVVARKSIVAAYSIKKGEMLTEGNLTVKRPGSGISPMMWDCVIGKIAIRDFEVDELIEI